MSIDSDRIAQLNADLAAVWERKRELAVVEVELRARLRKLEAVGRNFVKAFDELRQALVEDGR